jgi:hypothetical protein
MHCLLLFLQLAFSWFYLNGQILAVDCQWTCMVLLRCAVVQPRGNPQSRAQYLLLCHHGHLVTPRRLALLTPLLLRAEAEQLVASILLA